MNYKNHSIFNKDQQDQKLKKIYINKDSNNIWYFQKDKEKYNLAPASFTELSFSPLVAGADRAIIFGCKTKKIDYNNGLFLYFSEEEFLDCDVKLKLNTKFYDGWVYDVFSENVKVNSDQKIWACEYLNVYYEKPPETIYIKLESA